MTFSDQRGPGACARPAPVGVRLAANHLLEQKVLNIIQVGRQSDPKSFEWENVFYQKRGSVGEKCEMFLQKVQLHIKW